MLCHVKDVSTCIQIQCQIVIFPNEHMVHIVAAMIHWSNFKKRRKDKTNGALFTRTFYVHNWVFLLMRRFQSILCRQFMLHLVIEIDPKFCMICLNVVCSGNWCNEWFCLKFLKINLIVHNIEYLVVWKLHFNHSSITMM